MIDDANIEDAAESVVFGGFSNNGQIYMSTERVIIHQSIAGALTELILRKLRELKCRNQLTEPEVSMSGLYTPNSATRFLALIKSAIAQGAELLIGDQQATGPNATLIQPHCPL